MPAETRLAPDREAIDTFARGCIHREGQRVRQATTPLVTLGEARRLVAAQLGEPIAENTARRRLPVASRARSGARLYDPTQIEKFVEVYRAQRTSYRIAGDAGAPLTMAERARTEACEVAELLAAGKGPRAIALQLRIDIARVNKISREWAEAAVIEIDLLKATRRLQRRREALGIIAPAKATERDKDGETAVVDATDLPGAPEWFDAIRARYGDVVPASVVTVLREHFHGAPGSDVRNAFARRGFRVAGAPDG